MSDEATWLRQQPRQQRSIDRVEALLDTAEVVFREVGYDNATTNVIAERAGIPVGTLYRWFPDKAALAEGLAGRYLARLTERYEGFITSEPPATDLIRSAIHEIAQIVVDSPALPALTRAASGPATAGQLRGTIETAIDMVLRTRVPSITDVDARRVSHMATTVLIAVMADAAGLTGAEFDAAVDECANLMIAWLVARFPPIDDPQWKVEHPLVPPLAPALGDRLSLGADPPAHPRR